MRVEFSISVPSESELLPLPQHEALIDSAVDFMMDRPVFTAQELHEHLLQQFRLSEWPLAFWRYLDSIRQAVEMVCAARDIPTYWQQQEDDSYYDRLHSLGVGRSPSAEFDDPERLTELVRAELAALFHGRPEISETEMLFYMQAHQGFGNEAEAVLGLLVEDAFLTLTEAGNYRIAVPGEDESVTDEIFVPVLPARTASRAPASPAVEVDGVMMVGRLPPERRLAATALAAERSLPPEVSPPVPDEAFNVQDLARAMTVLNRLSWQNSRSDGVPTSVLVAYMEDGRITPRERTFIIVRLWRRGYLLRNASNPQDSVVRLRPDIPEERAKWQQTRAQILDELSKPYQPPDQPKTGS